MPTLLEVVIVPALIQVSEKPLFGKPFVRTGKLFIALGTFLYQQGGALGYGLTGHATLLGKLLGAKPDLTSDYVESLRKHEVSSLTEGWGRRRTFSSFMPPVSYVQWTST